jgi:hypothetical protein
LTSRRAVSVCVFFALVFTSTAAAGTDQLRVATAPTALTTSMGHKFVLHATVSNDGKTPGRNLVAHLNVVSLDGSVYVDPEDWSSNRTRYLPPIPARGSVSLSWKLQAVNSGQIGVYVAVLSRSGKSRPVAGPTVRVAIARRQTLNSGGILPLALGIPAVLSLIAGGLRIRRRRYA